MADTQEKMIVWWENAVSIREVLERHERILARDITPRDLIKVKASMDDILSSEGLTNRICEVFEEAVLEAFADPKDE